MAFWSVDRVGMARGRAIAAALVRGAQVRAAFEHLRGILMFVRQMAMLGQRVIMSATREFELPRRGTQVPREGFDPGANKDLMSVTDFTSAKVRVLIIDVVADTGHAAPYRPSCRTPATLRGVSGPQTALLAGDLHDRYSPFCRSLLTQRKPTWLVEVSIGSAWRAAGR